MLSLHTDRMLERGLREVEHAVATGAPNFEQLLSLSQCHRFVPLCQLLLNARMGSVLRARGVEALPLCVILLALRTAVHMAGD